MGSDARLPRYLGVAFIAQFVTSLTAGILSGSILTGSISDVLVNISANVTQMRASTLLELLTSVGIVALTSLLYIVLREENPAVAVVAFGVWLAEAVMLAVSTLGLYALVTWAQSSRLPARRTLPPTGHSARSSWASTSTRATSTCCSSAWAPSSGTPCSSARGSSRPRWPSGAS